MHNLSIWSPQLACGIALCIVCSGCARLTLDPRDWVTPSATDAPGTPAWWKKNKATAQFIPGKGYQVPGTDVFFDSSGRPIRERVERVVFQEEERKKQGILSDVEPIVTVSDIKDAVGLGPDERRAKDELVAGRGEFQQRAFKRAASHFKEAAFRWPDSALEQDAMFMLAESYFFNDKYAAATDAYEALVKKYPNSPYLDRTMNRQFAIAQFWMKKHRNSPSWPITPNFIDGTRPVFDTRGRAIKIYENIRLNDPTGPLADRALIATGHSYFLRGHYHDADYHYDLLRKEYPRSQFQYEAHILGLQCKLRKYQGPGYDGQPLEEAKVLVKQLKTQFGGELTAEERDRLRTVEGQLHHQLAQRDWSMARFYDNANFYGGARYYYEQIVKNYPDTALAAEARERATLIADKPTHPQDKLAWLIGIFPESRERAAVANLPEAETQLR